MDDLDNTDKSTPQIFDKSLQITDFMDILNLSKDFVTDSIPNFSENLHYRILSENEKNNTIKTVQETVARDDLTVSNPDALPRWEKGWQEILDLINQNPTLTEDLLIPQYFQKHSYLHFRDNYILAESNVFEHRLSSLIRRLIFKKYLSSAKKIVEFGCGTGTSIVILSDLFPEKSLVGCDWSKPAIDIIDLIAKKLHANVEGFRFNMFTLEGKDKIDFGSDDAVMTMHALEQIGSDFEPLLNFILSKKPSICVHLEPIYEFYEDNVYDNLAKQYHVKRNYLQGFLSKLRDLQKQGLIEIIEERRLKIGNSIHEHSSLVVWKPI